MFLFSFQRIFLRHNCICVKVLEPHMLFRKLHSESSHNLKRPAMPARDMWQNVRIKVMTRKVTTISRPAKSRPSCDQLGHNKVVSCTIIVPQSLHIFSSLRFYQHTPSQLLCMVSANTVFCLASNWVGNPSLKSRVSQSYFNITLKY